MYIALYRKYRPIDFNSVIGQEHITSTLKSEISEGKIAHAYLFAGTRGTGKTTCARILAKGVNCLNTKNGNPCNECANCLQINEGSMIDIVEIDAASNTGVDNIRDIRDEAVYTPVVCKKKVYIIDEVHMLSTGAFNALLKILEEPPEHVIFILATTEIHKIAPTILSRCQRFDFKRITIADIATYLQEICENEGVVAERNALFLIAKLGDGSMRDSLSILDKCISSASHLTYDFVKECVGATGKAEVYTLMRAIAAKDVDSLFVTLEQIYVWCKSVNVVASEITQCFRNIMIVKGVKNPLEILFEEECEIESLKEIAKLFPLSKIIYSINLLQELQNNLSRSQNQRLDFEVCLFKLCDERLSGDYSALVSRINTLEKKLESGVFSFMGETKKIDNNDVSNEKKTVEAAALPPTFEGKKAQLLPDYAEILEDAIAIIGPAYGSLLRLSKAYIEGERVYVVCGDPIAKAKFADVAIKGIVEKIIANKTGGNPRIYPFLKEEFKMMGKIKEEKRDNFLTLLDENADNNIITIKE